MKNKGLIATIVVLVAVIITLIAVVFLMQMPTIMSIEGLSNKSGNKKETSVVSTLETVETTRESEVETTARVPKKTTKIENHVDHNGHVKIDYPVIEGMEDKDLQARINEKIKTNALSVVPLYPISTALQDLEVSCEIKTFNDDHITIIYEGRVVGRANKGSSSSGNSGTQKPANYNSSTKDPYLDGFVDPLGIYGQAGRMGGIPQAATIAPQATTTVNNSNVEVSKSGQNQKVPTDNRTGTSDTGPSVSIIHSPTAPRNQSTYIDNTASNNPYNTGGSVYPNSGTRVNTAPTNSSSDLYNYPVSGFTNTSISTIDQKIYYTNTVDLRTGLDVSLKEYVSDLEKLSKWLRSSKVEFANVDESNRKAVREYVNLTVQSRYLTQMKNADFQNKGLKEWPKIFSYKDSDGTVYFSVKLSSKLGNYAIVKYKP